MEVAINDIITLFILVLPALVSNASPVVIAKLLNGRMHPIDFGRYFVDGRRILGDGKTWEGLAFGVAVGTLVGAIIGLALGDISYYTLAGLIGSFAALLGDILGSFIKRRYGIERGACVPILDQLDFYTLAVFALWLAGYPVKCSAAVLLGFFVIIAHVTTNYAAYRLDLKPRPC
ncbi:MAG: CDP-2,3-bis-(O-geranylgeranyl)-sn-glycerol synthase [Desulfurococcales archaeon]|nr:CDP-2,3-bis-(O-geranylgeranyl)-sn-glycerol synthase [Desulfurococcales archaeon]